jgi:glycosyltransferase involved in cell wall biosynthesis
MRLLVLTSSWPLHPGDARGSFVKDWCETLARRGFDIVVAAPRPLGDPPARSGDDDLVRVTWLPAFLPVRSRAFHGAGLESNLWRDPAAALGLPGFLTAFTLEAAARAITSDAIVAHWLLPMGAVGAAVARVSGRPLYVLAHSGPPIAARLPPMSLAVRAVVRAARSVACVSDSVLAEIRAAVGEGARLTTIPLGVDLRPVVGAPPGRSVFKRVLFVGRLVPLKGVDVLLRALVGMPNVQLTVVGDGPEGPALRRLAADLGVDARFAGEVDREDARRAMAGADLLVVPSRVGFLGRAEGLPRVIPEAWSCGLPVVTTSAGGAGEAVFRCGGGLLALPGDVADLRRAIHAVLEDDALRAGLSRGAVVAAADLSWDAVGARWAEWLEGPARSGR